MIVYKKILEYLDNKEKNENYKLIDYTRLSDSLTNDQIKDLCKEAEDNNFYAISVLPEFVASVESFVKNEIKVSALIDFPKGNSITKYKLDQIDKSIVNGADEIDVVLNYELIKKDKTEELETEIRKLTEYCHKEGSIIKLTIEIGALNNEEIEKICRMCIENNVDYISTSTGKLPNDESFEQKIEKVKFMRKILPDYVKIKFTGGIRTTEQIKEIKSLVDRIGTSIIPQ